MRIEYLASMPENTALNPGFEGLFWVCFAQRFSRTSPALLHVEGAVILMLAGKASEISCLCVFIELDFYWLETMEKPAQGRLFRIYPQGNLKQGHSAEVRVDSPRVFRAKRETV